jgi:hypothetical protein
MFEYYSSNSTMPFEYESSSNDDSDNYDRDPGRDVIEKNLRNRLQRFADYTKEELNKVLKRVDNVCHRIFFFLFWKMNSFHLLDIK